MGIIAKLKQFFSKDKDVQATNVIPEGGNYDVSIESLLSFTRVAGAVPGVTQDYKNYESQVTETYRKYNGIADFGNAQTRAIIDMRTAFIASEGISIVAEHNEPFEEWANGLIKKNKLDGAAFLNAAKNTEMNGKALGIFFVNNRKDIPLGEEPNIKVVFIHYHDSEKYNVLLRNKWDLDSVVAILKPAKNGGDAEVMFSKDFIFKPFGGDGTDVNETTTRVGLVLNEIENYDRALKDMRNNNYYMARITPVFKTADKQETGEIRKQIKNTRWKIGKAFVGTSDFRYETPGQGAHDNLKSELTTSVKTISTTTGVPVHWFGFVDLMSNRSTAETLYDFIDKATRMERLRWKEFFYDFFIDAQRMYIDNGGTQIRAIEKEFQVDIPVLMFSHFKEIVQSLSIAKGDEAISMADYRNFLPGINPMLTKKAIEAEKEEDFNNMLSRVPAIDINNEGDSEDE